MHENFSHNKEGILNTKDSPNLYFNENFNIFIYMRIIRNKLEKQEYFWNLLFVIMIL